ncbi:myosin light chain kinase A [Pelomyxa schiedti]|nr:myosin light chain kinase A [Pelomyxa schiedti]
MAAVPVPKPFWARLHVVQIDPPPNFPPYFVIREQPDEIKISCGTEVRGRAIHHTLAPLNSGFEIGIPLYLDASGILRKVYFKFQLGPPAPERLGFPPDHAIFQKYELTDRRLGQGASATVYEAFSRERWEWNAIKVFKASEVQPIQINREVGIPVVYKNEHVVSVKDYFSSPTVVGVVFEMARGGDLLEYIQKRDHLSEIQSFHFLSQIVDGLYGLHINRVMHRDLKPENILVMENDPLTDPRNEAPDIKIADFAFARVLNSTSMAARTLVGTPNYVAPEVLSVGEGLNGYGIKCDMWSLGVLLFVMLTGRFPFNGKDDSHTEQLIRSGHYTWRDDIPLSLDVKDLVTHLLDLNPDTRFDLTTLSKHIWCGRCFHVPHTRPISSNSQLAM